MATANNSRESSRWLKELNSFLLSAACHLLLLVLLGLVSIASTPDWQGVELSAQLVDGVESTIGSEEYLSELIEFDLPQAEDSTAQGVERLFEMSTVATSDSAMQEALSEVASIESGLAGAGIGELGMAASRKTEGTSEFFGIGGTGKSFVYVVDCSESMSGYKFDRACSELMQSIEHLYPGQRYFIIFYNNGAFPMDADEPVNATPEQIERTRRWISRMVPGGGTNPLPAVLYALSFQADAIFFLSDGRFDVEAGREIRRENAAFRERTPVHTIAFGSRENVTLMRSIARQSGGQFRYVE